MCDLYLYGVRHFAEGQIRGIWHCLPYTIHPHPLYHYPYSTSRCYLHPRRAQSAFPASAKPIIVSCIVYQNVGSSMRRCCCSPRPREFASHTPGMGRPSRDESLLSTSGVQDNPRVIGITPRSFSFQIPQLASYLSRKGLNCHGSAQTNVCNKSSPCQMGRSFTHKLTVVNSRSDAEIVH